MRRAPVPANCSPFGMALQRTHPATKAPSSENFSVSPSTAPGAAGSQLARVVARRTAPRAAAPAAPCAAPSSSSRAPAPAAAGIVRPRPAPTSMAAPISRHLAEVFGPAQRDVGQLPHLEQVRLEQQLRRQPASASKTTPPNARQPRSLRARCHQPCSPGSDATVMACRARRSTPSFVSAASIVLHGDRSAPPVATEAAFRGMDAARCR